MCVRERHRENWRQGGGRQGTVYFLEASKMWKVETEDAGNRTPGSIRGVSVADPVRKGSRGEVVALLSGLGW